jgi:hypothetical protein
MMERKDADSTASVFATLPADRIKQEEKDRYCQLGKVTERCAKIVS